MNLPIVSIIIATFNSEKVLPRTLEAIRNQNYPMDRIEVIVVDGGSTDSTLEIAKRFGCIVFPNPKTEPVNAKLIGFNNANGEYIITIDHDEVIQNRNSILLKVQALKSNPECKVALCSGYKRPADYPLLNQYISEFGDPFSLFLYHLSKDCVFFEKSIKSKFKILYENQKYLLVSFEKLTVPVIIELCCLGTMIEKKFFADIPGAFEDGAVFTHLFYLMLEREVTNVIMIKEDPLVHYSVDSLKAYLPKLRWRIVNNVHFAEKGENGYSGREKYQKKIKWKKYFYLIYSFTLIGPLVEGVLLGCSRKNGIYLLHPALSLYVATEIVIQYIRKLFHCPPKFMSYDGKKEINR